jgi:hypothetical protein
MIFFLFSCQGVDLILDTTSSDKNGSLNDYLACWTRPGIYFAVSHSSQFLSNPGDSHMIAAF